MKYLCLLLLLCLVACGPSGQSISSETESDSESGSTNTSAGAKVHNDSPQERVEILAEGTPIHLDSSLTLEADNEGPYLIFGGIRRSDSPLNWIELAKIIEVWNEDLNYRLELLGKSQDIEHPGYVVKVRVKPSPEPVIENTPVSGMIPRNPQSPQTGYRYRGSLIVISRSPFLAFTGNSSNNAILMTNFGVAELSSENLRPQEIYFKKDSGERIRAGWNAKLQDYDIPNSARGHGVIDGPLPCKPSVMAKIGPAAVYWTREFPGSKDVVSMNIGPARIGHGPILEDVQFAEYSTACLGIPSYTAPKLVSASSSNAQSKPDTTVQHESRDSTFPEIWELRLNPPIKEEFGLGVDGPLVGEAVVVAKLWKIGDRVYGSGGYTYSDCDAKKSCNFDGSVSGAKLKLKLTGDLNMELSLPFSNSAMKGRARLGLTDERDCTMTVANETKLPYSERDEYAALAKKLLSMPKNKNYWNEITASPGVAYRRNIVDFTLKLAESESKSGLRADETMNAIYELAHQQYQEWLSARHRLGDNNSLTKAHAEIVDCLYKRLAENPKIFVSGLKNYVAFLRESNRRSEAEKIEALIPQDRR